VSAYGRMGESSRSGLSGPPRETLCDAQLRPFAVSPFRPFA